MTYELQPDRRTFLRTMGATGLALGTGASWFLSACSNDNGAATKAPSGGSAQLGTLAVGQTLKGDIYSDVAKSLPRGGSVDITLTSVAATLNILTST
ncbi:MAG TPA: twin-arginine translocation signal domain-containing protein, partial [Thermoleophilaceae bacterium]|nr:twin-arginine translocation signal domain-containing protein [Thermoleophilaceae bacterium]